MVPVPASNLLQLICLTAEICHENVEFNNVDMKLICNLLRAICKLIFQLIYTQQCCNIAGNKTPNMTETQMFVKVISVGKVIQTKEWVEHFHLSHSTKYNPIK